MKEYTEKQPTNFVGEKIYGEKDFCYISKSIQINFSMYKYTSSRISIHFYEAIHSGVLKRHVFKGCLQYGPRQGKLSFSKYSYPNHE